MTLTPRDDRDLAGRTSFVILAQARDELFLVPGDPDLRALGVAVANDVAQLLVGEIVVTLAIVGLLGGRDALFLILAAALFGQRLVLIGRLDDRRVHGGFRH